MENIFTWIVLNKCPKRIDIFNYKGYFSVILQEIANANYKFVAIEVGAYGKQCDGRTFSDSNVYQQFEASILNISDNENIPSTDISTPFVLLDDEAYPLKTYFLNPYLRQRLTVE